MQQNHNALSKDNSLTSVGIDIGTTSCHLVFSRLSLRNEASATQIPRLVIGEREIFYESPIYFTPLYSDGSIDGAKVAELMRAEYSHAGITSDDINCGAVIITGETARLRNAEHVLNEISSLAGDFVAASAGPELESILAGRGSGALQYSKESGKTVCNIDIGGGTTNIAVFKNGSLIETSCLRIGGRCLQFTRDGVLTKLSESGNRLIKKLEQNNTNLDGVVSGAAVSKGTLFLLAQNAADLILNFVCGSEQTVIAAHASELVRNKEGEPLQRLGDFIIGPPLSNKIEIDEYWFSGGVAELMAEVSKLQAPANSVIQSGSARKASLDAFNFQKLDPFKYEDFGYFLAIGIRAGIEVRNLQHRVANNAIRATVVGAGSYSVQLSGNTVSAAISHLPKKSIPLIRLVNDAKQNSPTKEDVASCLSKAIAGHDKKPSQKSFAIILHFDPTPKYADLRHWASALAFACQQNELCLPYIFIVNTDSAMALGQLLRGELRHDDVIVLDGIDLTTGDFVDIGKPISTGATIPVTVKSLIFSNE